MPELGSAILERGPNGPRLTSPISEAHALRLGRFIATFQVLEALLNRYLAMLLDAPDSAETEAMVMAAPVKKRIQVFAALLRKNAISEDHLPSVKALEKKLGKANTRRNQLAHGEWHLEFESNVHKIRHVTIYDASLGKSTDRSEKQLDEYILINETLAWTLARTTADVLGAKIEGLPEWATELPGGQDA